MPATSPWPATTPTYPTFLYGDVVVKLFGNTPWWHEGHAAERFPLQEIGTLDELAEVLFAF